MHTGEIRLEQRQRPLLFYDAGEIETIRELSRQEGSFQHRRYQAIVRDTDEWLRRPLPIPDKNAEGKWLGLYICPADSTGLIYDPHEPHRHTCPKCGGSPYRRGVRPDLAGLSACEDRRCGRRPGAAVRGGR